MDRSAIKWDRSVVTSDVVRKGLSFYKYAHRIFMTYVSARVFLQDKFLGVVVPYFAYIVLARSGQTHILDKVMFMLASDLMVTATQKYASLFVQYGLTKLVIPRLVGNELYTDLSDKTVLSIMSSRRRRVKRAHDGVHVFHDEAQEMRLKLVFKSIIS